MTPEWQPISSEEYEILFARSLDHSTNCDLPLTSETPDSTHEKKAQDAPSRFDYAKPIADSPDGNTPKEPEGTRVMRGRALLGLGLFAVIIGATSVAFAGRDESKISGAVQPAAVSARAMSSKSADIELTTRFLAAPRAESTLAGLPRDVRDLANAVSARSDSSRVALEPKTANRAASPAPLPALPLPNTAIPRSSTTATITLTTSTPTTSSPTTSTPTTSTPTKDAPRTAGTSPATTTPTKAAPSTPTTITPTSITPISTGTSPATTAPATTAPTTTAPTITSTSTTTESPSSTTTVSPDTTVPACHPAYAGACVPFASDVDCEKRGRGKGGNGPEFVAGPFIVVDPSVDPYNLDPDGDGMACDK